MCTDFWCLDCSKKSEIEKIAVDEIEKTAVEKTEKQQVKNCESPKKIKRSLSEIFKPLAIHINPTLPGIDE